MIANEIRTNVNLSMSNGKLNPEAIGWARKPLIESNVSGSFLRKKKWNYWCVTSPEVLFSATISHIDYAAVMFVYILDVKTLDFFEKTILIPLGKGLDMPNGVQETITFNHKEMTIYFIDQDNETHLNISCPSFDETGNDLTATIKLDRAEDYESLNVVVPWSESRYQFTSKQPVIPAQGVIKWGEREYQLEPKNAYGCLDYGRGIWKYHSTWNWASASGITSNKLIGLNFGGQWTDGTGQNENGIIIDNRLHKIHEDIIWEYDTEDYMKPWKLTTEGSKRVELTFTPIFERVATTDAAVIQSSVHQMVGHFNGTIVSDEGESIEIKQLFGWAEDHMAKW